MRSSSILEQTPAAFADARAAIPRWIAGGGTPLRNVPNRIQRLARPRNRCKACWGVTPMAVRATPRSATATARQRTLARWVLPGSEVMPRILESAHARRSAMV